MEFGISECDYCGLPSNGQEVCRDCAATEKEFSVAPSNGEPAMNLAVKAFVEELSAPDLCEECGSAQWDDTAQCALCGAFKVTVDSDFYRVV